MSNRPKIDANNPDPFCPFICPRATGGPVTAAVLLNAPFPVYETDDAALRDLRDAATTILAVTARFQDAGPRAAKIGAGLTVACGSLHAVRASYIRVEHSGLHEIHDQ